MPTTRDLNEENDSDQMDSDNESSDSYYRKKVRRYNLRNMNDSETSSKNDEDSYSSNDSSDSEQNERPSIPSNDRYNTTKCYSTNLLVISSTLVFFLALGVALYYPQSRILLSNFYDSFAPSCGPGMQIEPLSTLIAGFTAALDNPHRFFNPHDVISALKFRSGNLPTLIYLAGSSKNLQSGIAWIKTQLPCSSQKLSCSGNDQHLKTLIEEQITISDHQHSSSSAALQCRVVLTIMSQNADILESNRNWLESVVDDTAPIAYLNDETIPTNDWCVFIQDEWSPERLEMANQIENSNLLENFVRESVRRKWTDRFTQRISKFVYLG